jgi:hypothetical protein
MRIASVDVIGAVCLLPLLTACITSSNPPPPASNTTVVVPQGTMMCQEGNKPPCYDSQGKLLICADGTKPPCK